MKVWSFCDSQSGMLSRRTFSGPDDSIAANTPPGLQAIEGEHDHLSRRVDLATGEVIDWQPPAPSTDHEWNATSRRWELSADAIERAEKLQRAQARINHLELAQLRPLRELVRDPQNAAALARMDEIEAEIAGLRADLTAPAAQRNSTA